MSRLGRSHREVLRPSKFWTPESPRPSFRLMNHPGNMGRNQRKREMKEFTNQFTHKQLREMKIHERRETFKEVRSQPKG